MNEETVKLSKTSKGILWLLSTGIIYSVVSLVLGSRLLVLNVDLLSILFPVALFFVAMLLKRIVSEEALLFVKTVVYTSLLLVVGVLLTWLSVAVNGGSRELSILYMLVKVAAWVMLYLGVVHLENTDPRGKFEGMKLASIGFIFF